MSLGTISRLTSGVLGTLLLTSIPATGLPWSAVVDTEARTPRFQILEQFRGEAVLDNETLLIWERSPNTSEAAWANASLRCALTSTGGRLGWRLPSFFELMTLVEPALRTATSKPSLPAGHPFRGVKADPYWTTNTQDIEPANAYTVDFLRGDVAVHRKNRAHSSWCVRGGPTNAPSPDLGGTPLDSI